MINKIFNSIGLPSPQTEYKFHPLRKWRVDYAFPDVNLAIEQEGGAWSFGRHNRAKGFIEDMKKYNALIELNWVLLRYQPNEFDYDQIKRVYLMRKKLFT